ncbi:ABC transporter substrate-binding protein [Rhodophyticola porphyridii]|uniref:Twin-arginine translocation pathway signal protein n=1 Tax=Rhodophyticola porphyridii TaxID=1852017 RepID=A0A3L9Y0T7_9RHOB|nr:ABC transporter substrate-binding protein [Rhodophyticola porphyridii]RMA40697.1 twin-arginine translocation pathway signal protein [Rhodophyticola porphyridii]
MTLPLRTSAFAAMLSATVLSPVMADEIRTINLVTRPQAAQPAEFQFTQLIAQEWRRLGLDVNVEVMPWEQMIQAIWFSRDDWDTTAWQMVGRPERSDPDEIVYNLFHSTTAEQGFNFIGYNNPEYDALVEQQRVTLDPDERREIVRAAQAMLAEDQPNMMLAHPQSTYAFNTSVWNPDTVVDQSGIGIRNTWSYLQMEPLGDVTDIILNSSDNVTAINPLYISGGTDSWITELVYDRLMRIGPDGLPQPWAAESYEWIDDTTIRVTLREGMTWHDGMPVTPEDVAFSFEAAGSGEAPMYGPFVGSIADITIDGMDITFSLTEPSAPFLTASLSKINLIPMHIWEPVIAEQLTLDTNAESFQEEVPIGSGPYRFGSWTLNEEVVLEANAEHWAAPKADRWILRIVPNVEAALGMLRSGEINFLSDFPGDPTVVVAAADEDPNLTAVSTVDIGFRYVAFNHRRPPFNDPAFRRALSASVDRRLIVGAAFRGFAVPSNSVVSPALGFWHNEATVEGMEAGIELAQQMLEDAGYMVVDGRLHYPEGVSETLGE